MIFIYIHKMKMLLFFKLSTENLATYAIQRNVEKIFLKQRYPRINVAFFSLQFHWRIKVSK